jgi:hypothetical protein
MAKSRTDTKKRGSQNRQALYIKSRTVNTYPWPRSDTPVSIGDAMAAVTLGHAPTLARYLRQVGYHGEEICPLIPIMMSEQLDPMFLDPSSMPPPPYVRTSLKLVFVKKNRGRQRNIKYNLLAIGTSIAGALGTPPNLEAAIAQVRQDARISRATAFRAWKTYKSAHGLDWEE